MSPIFVTINGIMNLPISRIQLFCDFAYLPANTIQWELTETNFQMLLLSQTCFCIVPPGANKVKVSPRRKYQQEFTERTPDYVLEESEIQELDYEQENNPVPLTEGDALDLYRIVSEMDR